MKWGDIELSDWYIVYDSITDKEIGWQKGNDDYDYIITIFKVENKVNDDIEYLPAFQFKLNRFHSLFYEKYLDFDSTNLGIVKNLVDDFIISINKINSFW